VLRKKRLEATPGAPIVADRQTDRKKVLENPSDAAPLRLEDQLDTFWQTGIDLDTFIVKPRSPDIDKAVLKRLGPSPLTVGQQNITDIFWCAYDRIRATTEQQDEE